MEGEAGGKLMVGGTAEELRGRVVGVLGERCRPPKKEGRREKMLWLEGAEAAEGFVRGVESWWWWSMAASIVPASRDPVLRIRGRRLLQTMADGSSSALPTAAAARQRRTRAKGTTFGDALRCAAMRCDVQRAREVNGRTYTPFRARAAETLTATVFDARL